MDKIALVGSPNVGKSVLFNELTGTYVTVSNYPGTTVDVSRGQCRIYGKTYEVMDTPGIYSFMPITDEERVTRELLCREQPDIVIHVMDAKNIRRMLFLTLQLLDAGFPVILNLNVIDEARQMGIHIDSERLSSILGIPVNTTVAVKKIGIGKLKQEIYQYKCEPSLHLNFSEDIEAAIVKISNSLTRDYGIAKRMVALLLLQEDKSMLELVRQEEKYLAISKAVHGLTECYQQDIEGVLTLERQKMIDKILGCTVKYSRGQPKNKYEQLGRWAREPATGVPLLLLILYFGLYQIVGKFGAGFLVDYLDTYLFSEIITPIAEVMVNQYIPWEWAQSMLVGEYGVFSLGIRYAVAIILPIVGTFFFVFAILEDCGYLPRLAMLVDKVFKYFGLNGRAVIPITLGLGCGTMAIMVTRTLETRRERLLATFLLSLTIPCSAQLGLVLALLSHNVAALLIWGIVMLLVFVVVGWLSATIMPGERSPFYLEIPPLRLPVLSNIITKAFTRMSWYFMEILPVFILTSLILWISDSIGLLSCMIQKIEPIMSLLGLPRETAQTFLLGFFRRDYGAAGLYDMCIRGLLTDQQLVVAAVTLTLFVPCVAQLAVMIKERGLFSALFMVMLIIGIALLTGGLLNQIMHWFSIQI